MSDTVPSHELHRVVANCVIYNDYRQYLIAKRAPHLKIFPDKWEISGGGISREDYEHTPPNAPDHTWEYAMEQALQREIDQEIGVQVENIKYVGSCSFIRPDDVAVIALRYMAHFKSGPIVLNLDEAVEFKWISVHELSQYDFLGNVAEVIRQVDKILMYENLGGAAA